MPRETAWRMAATESLSSWLPQPTAQSPPTAQEPKPTRVICISVLPNRLVGNGAALFKFRLIFCPSVITVGPASGYAYLSIPVEYSDRTHHCECTVTRVWR